MNELLEAQTIAIIIGMALMSNTTYHVILHFYVISFNSDYPSGTLLSD